MKHQLYKGENLAFLKAYNTEENLKSIDFVYIDPPYNTGNTVASTNGHFTYGDSFKKDGTMSNHQVWSKFLEERLLETLPLMKDTGVIAVSIDDREIHYLRFLLDGVFGEKNFIAQIVVDGGTQKNNAKFISTSHEYLVVYAKNLKSLSPSGIKWRQKRDGMDILRKEESRLRKIHGTDYTAISKELKLWYKTAPLSARLKVFTSVDAKGLYTYADLSAPGSSKNVYDVLHPISQLPTKVPSRGWGLSEKKMEALIADDMIIFGEGVDGHLKQPLKKLYLSDSKDQVIRSIMEFSSRQSTHLLEKMLDTRKGFNNPKNLDFIKHIIDAMCPDDGTVMDYFAGSGTTGHAVIDLNDEGANRTFVLCTNNENGIFDKVTQPRLEIAISGKWLNGKNKKPKLGQSIDIITL